MPLGGGRSSAPAAAVAPGAAAADLSPRSRWKGPAKGKQAGKRKAPVPPLQREEQESVGADRLHDGDSAPAQQQGSRAGSARPRSLQAGPEATHAPGRRTAMLEGRPVAAAGEAVPETPQAHAAAEQSGLGAQSLLHRESARYIR